MGRKIKNIKKILLIIFLNLIILILLFFICDYFVYKTYINIYKTIPPYDIENFHYEIITKKRVLKRELKTFRNWLRKPDGLQYKNKSKHSIVLFGCSYAYGEGLSQEQTLSYKLAKYLKTPVYNRALSWGNLQEMWYQVAAEGKSIYPSPLADTYIYLMMYDHYNRMYSFFTIYTRRQYLNYIDKNNNLTTQIQRTPIESFLKASYLYRHIDNMILHKYLQNPKNKDEIINRAVKYIVNSKKELENQNGKDIKFIVIFYDNIDIKYEKELIEQLHKNNIHTIRTKDLTKENLKNIKYTISNKDKHPNENAWNLLTPLIAREIQKIWEQ